MPQPPPPTADPEAVLEGLDPDAIRAELDRLDRRAALRVMLRAANLHRRGRTPRRPTGRRGEHVAS
jgi:hypothetical protein